MLAARALADAAPNDHYKRILARQVYVFAAAFLNRAYDWRSELARHSGSRARAQEGRRRLRKLAGTYNQSKRVRDYLAAKRQPAHTVRAQDAELTLELWISIDQRGVASLIKQALRAYEALVPADESANEELALTAAPEVLRTALARLGPPGEEANQAFAVGSYAAAVPGTNSVHLGGGVGRRITHVNDVNDQLLTLETLWPAVDGLQPFHRLVCAALIAEISTLLDLTIGPPEPHEVRCASLLQLCREQNASEGERVLDGIRENLPDEWRAYFKEARNMFGAHVDARVPYDELRAELDDVDMAQLIEMISGLRRGLKFAALYDQGLRMLFFNRRVSAAVPRQPITPGQVGPVLPPGISPEMLDSPYVIVTDSANTTGAVAGMMASWQRQLAAELGVELVEPSAGTTVPDELPRA